MMLGMRWGRTAGRSVWALVLVALAMAPAMAACGDGSADGPPKPTTARFKAGASSSPGGLTLKSTAFGNGGPIPERYSCKGENTPPPLTWTGVPGGTTNVALVITDPDAPNGIFVHWIVMGLPSGTNGSLTNGALPPGARVEKNSAEQAGYTGMCPPAGAQHTYVFEIMALSRPVTFPANASPLEKVKALRLAAGKTGKLTGEFKG